MRLPGMLHGEILRSPHPSARIVSIDTAAAAAVPGVLAVYTQADMPQGKYGAFVQDETALADGVVRYQGEGVAAVIAIDEPTALRAMELIDVDYEPLPGVFDPEAAMEEGAPAVHDGRRAQRRRPQPRRTRATSTPASKRPTTSSRTGSSRAASATRAWSRTR